MNDGNLFIIGLLAFVNYWFFNYSTSFFDTPFFENHTYRRIIFSILFGFTFFIIGNTFMSLYMK